MEGASQAVRSAGACRPPSNSPTAGAPRKNPSPSTHSRSPVLKSTRPRGAVWIERSLRQLGRDASVSQVQRISSALSTASKRPDVEQG